MLVFPCSGVLTKVKRILAFLKIFGFDSSSSIKVLSSKTKNVSPKYDTILPKQGMPFPIPSQNVLIKAAVAASP